MKVDILENERIDDLQLKGLKIIQKTVGFCFGVDAVLLSSFVDVKKGTKVLDLGTGTGIIPILLAGKTLAEYIVGLEIQSSMAQMAKRSICLNSLEDRLDIVEGDIKECNKIFGKGTFDVVVSNPPYMNNGGGLVNPTDMKAISRHEILCSLKDVIKAASDSLKVGGQFAMVHRPERLVDIMCLMREYKIEPKYLRFVHPYPNKKPNMVLVKGTRCGNAQLKIMEPLYVFDENGKYSNEIDEIYGRTTSENKDV